MWKLPMGGSDTKFDRLSRKHPAVLRSIPLYAVRAMKEFPLVPAIFRVLPIHRSQL